MGPACASPVSCFSFSSAVSFVPPPGRTGIILSRSATLTIARRARLVVRHPGFCSSDLADVVQELTVRLWRRAADYDPSRSSPATFIDRVVASGAADIIRTRRRLKRHGFAVSLERTPSSDDGVMTTLQHTLVEQDQTRRTLSERKTSRTTLSPEVAEVIASLPDELRNLAVHLQSHGIQQTAAEMKISRRQVYRLMDQLRERFRAAGFSSISTVADHSGDKRRMSPR
jgi:RNA polymerase sigma factor (sigma-70 family)